MPKSVDVEDFAAKLELLMKRLNWSRAKLAQQVGIDKSLSARWINGNSRPTGNSLMQLTAAAAQEFDGFTAADWDLTADQFARRLGISPTPPAAAATGRLMLSGLHRAPPATTWGVAYVGLWAGFYQSLTNRGVARVSAGQFTLEGGELRFAYTDGFFSSEGPAIATHTHLHAVGAIVPLENRLVFFAFNAVQDGGGVGIIDGVKTAVGADDTPSATPVLLIRIDNEADEQPIGFESLVRRVARANERIENEAQQIGDALAGARQIAPPDMLRSLWPVVGAARPDGEIDHILRMPRKRSLATGRRAMDGLPPDAPLRMVPANLRRLLGLDTLADEPPVSSDH
jgi:transcriptional regulator with XRE-family HTH domain